jgi:hypothetical protein
MSLSTEQAEPHSGDTTSQVVLGHADTRPRKPVCTPVCTGNQEYTQNGGLDALAAALLNLSPDDRDKLLNLLRGEAPEKSE